MIIHMVILAKQSLIWSIDFSHRSEVDERIGRNVVQSWEGTFKKKFISKDSTQRSITTYSFVRRLSSYIIQQHTWKFQLMPSNPEIH